MPAAAQGERPQVESLAEARPVEEVATASPADALGDSLLAAAAEEFAAHGYDRAGVASIARRAGVTTGAIYSRYRGKADLLVDAVRTHCTGPLDDILLRNATGETAARFAAAGSHIGSRGLGLGQTLLLEAMVAARRDPELRAVLQERMSERRGQLETAINTAQRSGDIDPTLDTHAVVQFMHAVALGYLLQDAVELERPSPEGWSRLVDRVVDALSASADSKGEG